MHVLLLLLSCILSVAPHPRTTGLEKIYDGRSCERPRYDFCREFGNATKFPNFVGYDLQEDAALEAGEFLRFAQACDSIHMKEFICSIYFPVCFRDRVKRPRRSLCRKSQKKCFHLMEVLGYDRWPFNCTDFPVDNKPAKEFGCEQITVPTCLGFGYAFTKLPNQFSMDNQSLIAETLMPYDYRYFESRGSTSTFWRELNEFLCNAFLPRCNRGQSKSPSVATCMRLKTASVEPLMHHYLEWPTMADCELLRRPPRQRCTEPLRVTTCQGLGYRTTRFPHDLAGSQQEAADKVRQFWPMISMGCSSETKKFICGVYFPRCTRFGDIVPVFKTVCQRIKRACTTSLRATNPHWVWPRELDCERFP